MAIPEPVMLPYSMTSTQNPWHVTQHAWAMWQAHVYIKINKKVYIYSSIYIYIYEVGDCSQPLHLGPHWTVSYPNPNRFTLDVTVHTDSVHFYSVTVDETRRCTRFDLRPLTKLDEVWGGSADEVHILTDFTLRFWRKLTCLRFELRPLTKPDRTRYMSDKYK